MILQFKHNNNFDNIQQSLQKVMIMFTIDPVKLVIHLQSVFEVLKTTGLSAMTNMVYHHTSSNNNSATGKGKSHRMSLFDWLDHNDALPAIHFCYFW
jgi:hypothetical protein